MNELTQFHTLSPGSMIGNTLYVPTQGFLVGKRVPIGLFRRATLVETTDFDIAQIQSTPRYFSAFDPFFERKIEKNISETGEFFRECTVKLLSQDLIFGSSEDQKSVITLGLEVGVLQKVSYSEACEKILEMIHTPDLGDEKDFQILMGQQVERYKTKIQNIGRGNDQIFQVQAHEHDGVNLFPKDFFTKPPQQIQGFNFRNLFPLFFGNNGLSPIPLGAGK